ncbi:hypothetical protein OOT33_13190 [Sphingobium sp. DEHP117]|uniref:hypothetical protein n=1 Tax=Sphingobium sp. DEHP117 TaxID=2993436 RepID=UPI0027D54734|nr:hypothetical protein [Sphingobium sp. DEHP117]MDQ4421378.1 hypothetical protein [Sphingobium sp. DEHP117]
MRYWVGIFAAAALSCQSAWAKKEESVIVGGKPMPISVYFQRMMGGGPILDEPDLKAAVAKAEAFPLGTKENPVRAESPAGQRAYLSRLKCPDNSTPSFMRAGISARVFMALS